MSLGASKPMGQNMIPKIGYGYICLREGEEGRAKDMLLKVALSTINQPICLFLMIA
jgi:hypothetical protein